MEVTWRNVALLDAFTGSLTSTGTALLAREIADERLAVITLVGAPSSQRRRVELFAQLLNQQHVEHVVPNAPLTLLTCVSYVEEDYRVVVLDVNAVQGAPGWELIGAFCALSSLVVSCYDDDEGYGCSSSVVLPGSIPPFTSLFQTLVKEYPTVEVHELLPKMLTIDFSPSRSFQDQPLGANDDVTVLDGIVQFKRLGVAYPADISSTQLLDFFSPHAPVKKLFNTDLTGDILLLMLQSFTRDVHNGDEPDVGSAWDGIVEQKCAAISEDALHTYLDCMHSSAREEPPIELDAFNQLHDEILRLAMDVYHAGSKTFKSTRRRTVRNKLKASIRAKYEEELETLRDHSRKYCEHARGSIWKQLSRESLEGGDGEKSDGKVSFAAVLNTILRFDEQYNQQASGPEKASVLRGFYRHEAIQVFQRLEAIVTQQMTAVHLQELRAQLENEFEDKKEALIHRFKQEETQLRACMAREIETMQKMHQARSSRVKIDESETKRVREELSLVKKLNAELERKQAVVEQTQEDFLNQKVVLERKVEELELAVRHEMASRAELVDTLAGTIKNAEQKERALQMEIEELRHEVGEKTFRVEHELKDVTLQLRKTNEVRQIRNWAINSWHRFIISALMYASCCYGTAGKRRAAKATERFLHQDHRAPRSTSAAFVLLRKQCRGSAVCRCAHGFYEQMTDQVLTGATVGKKDNSSKCTKSPCLCFSSS